MPSSSALLTPILSTPDGGLERIVVPGHLAIHLWDAVGQRVDEAGLWRRSVTADTAFIAAQRGRSVTSVQARSHPSAPAIRMIADIDGDAASQALSFRDLFCPFPHAGVVFVVPSRDQLLALPLVDMGSLGWMDVLANACLQAYAACEQPLSDRLFWYDGSSFQCFGRTQTSEGLVLDPPVGFGRFVQRLACRALRPVDAVA